MGAASGTNLQQMQMNQNAGRLRPPLPRGRSVLSQLRKPKQRKILQRVRYAQAVLWLLDLQLRRRQYGKVLYGVRKTKKSSE